jgi:phosphatidate cytidylyltransferase
LVDWPGCKVLRTRVITAIIISAFGVTALFVLPPLGFALLAMTVLLALGGWEGARLGGLQTVWARALFAATLVAASGLLLLKPAGSIVALLIPGCLAWLIFLTWLTRPDLGRSNIVPNRIIKLLAVAIILLSAWLALSWLQASSPWHVLLLLVVIAAADVGAFFTGKTIGGPKLAPRLSPGKTRSGALGGLACAMVLTAIAAALIPASPFLPMTAGLLALALALISIGGDLFVSLLKRHAALKDTSNLLPGHGGILDRFDSIGAALPFFALAVALWGH